LNIESFFKTYFALARDGKLNKRGLPNLFLIATISLAHQNEIGLANPPWIVQKTIFTILAPISKLLGFKAEYD